MRKHEISAKFNPIIASAIADGFYPCMTELTGSYSDVMGTQIVLAKGSERMVLWMEEHIGLGSRGVVSDVTLCASSFTLGAGESIESSYRWSTQWKEHIFWSETVYQVSEGRYRDDGWYTEDKAEAEQARVIRNERWKASFVGWSKDYEITDTLLRIVRKLKGFKTVARKNIRVWKHDGVWHIENTASRNEVTLSA